MCVWVQLCSHLLSSSGARNDSRGKQTGKGGWGEREGVYVCVCVWWGWWLEKKDEK